MSQENATSSALVASSQLAFPEASSFLPAPVSAEQTLAIAKAQQETILQSLQNLSQTKPSVRVKLNEPLTSQVFDALIEKGYNVATHSQMSRDSGGHNEQRHYVTISLPGASTDLAPSFYRSMFDNDWWYVPFGRNRAFWL
jgi:hypothetical protein